MVDDEVGYPTAAAPVAGASARTGHGAAGRAGYVQVSASAACSFSGAPASFNLDPAVGRSPPRVSA
jgi:hypothetical protein